MKDFLMRMYLSIKTKIVNWKLDRTLNRLHDKANDYGIPDQGFEVIRDGNGNIVDLLATERPPLYLVE